MSEKQIVIETGTETGPLMIPYDPTDETSQEVPAPWYLSQPDAQYATHLNTRSFGSHRVTAQWTSSVTSSNAHLLLTPVALAEQIDNLVGPITTQRIQTVDYLRNPSKYDSNTDVDPVDPTHLMVRINWACIKVQVVQDGSSPTLSGPAIRVGFVGAELLSEDDGPSEEELGSFLHQSVTNPIVYSDKSYMNKTQNQLASSDLIRIEVPVSNPARATVASNEGEWTAEVTTPQTAAYMSSTAVVHISPRETSFVLAPYLAKTSLVEMARGTGQFATIPLGLVEVAIPGPLQGLGLVVTVDADVSLWEYRGTNVGPQLLDATLCTPWTSVSVGTVETPDETIINANSAGASLQDNQGTLAAFKTLTFESPLNEPTDYAGTPYLTCLACQAKLEIKNGGTVPVWIRLLTVANASSIAEISTPAVVVQSTLENLVPFAGSVDPSNQELYGIPISSLYSMSQGDFSTTLGPGQSFCLWNAIQAYTPHAIPFRIHVLNDPSVMEETASAIVEWKITHSTYESKAMNLFYGEIVAGPGGTNYASVLVPQGTVLGLLTAASDPSAKLEARMVSSVVVAL